MANDLAGLQQTIKDALDATVADKGLYNSENELRLIRTFAAQMHKAAVANGVPTI